jgi:hypothetical protein
VTLWGHGAIQRFDRIMDTVPSTKQTTTAGPIDMGDYKYFHETSSKDRNDAYNKKRETIICAMINDQIPEEFYSSPHWEILRQNLAICIQNEILPILGIEDMESIWCEVKAGRKNSHDFLLKVNGVSAPLEFKYGVDCVNDAPQFVSLMKPSQYLEENFEGYFYDNYFHKIHEKYLLKTGDNRLMASKEVYVKTNHSENVPCLMPYKQLYETDKEFITFCRSIEEEAVGRFIHEVDPKLNILSDKLKTKQKDKIYLLYKDGKFTTETMNEDLFQLVSVVERKGRCYICETACGGKISIRLRFKNGCGIQFPALQIREET